MQLLAPQLQKKNIFKNQLMLSVEPIKNSFRFFQALGRSGYVVWPSYCMHHYQIIKCDMLSLAIWFGVCIYMSYHFLFLKA